MGKEMGIEKVGATNKQILQNKARASTYIGINNFKQKHKITINPSIS